MSQHSSIWTGPSVQMHGLGGESKPHSAPANTTPRVHPGSEKESKSKLNNVVLCPPQAVPGIKYVNIYKIPPQCPGLQDFKGSEMWASFVPPDPLCSLLRAALYPRRLCMGPLPSDTQPVVREPKEKGNGALTPQLDLCWITLHAGLTFSLQLRFSPVLPSPL